MPGTLISITQKHKACYIAVFIVFVTLTIKGQDDTFRIMFYNCENLFDTKDDTLSRDEEFLPDGDRKWDNFRFYKKLNNIAKVIIGVGEWQAPAVVGLCEIENRFVLNQLVYETPLKKFGYRILHRESPDWRGIDVACLYRKDVFHPDTFLTIPVRFPFDPDSRTRDILYVKGRFYSNDSLHLFINHWPSRYGGYLETEKKRQFAATILRRHVDSLLMSSKNCKIMIMGDFNDGPKDASISEILQTRLSCVDAERGCLINLMFPYVDSSTSGTLKYRESWDVFDQVIVSQSLLKADSGLSVSPAKAYIYKPAYLLIEDETYMGLKPFRTYYGFKYQGGFSDHLPVWVQIVEEMSGVDW